MIIGIKKSIRVLHGLCSTSFALSTILLYRRLECVIKTLCFLWLDVLSNVQNDEKTYKNHDFWKIALFGNSIFAFFRQPKRFDAMVWCTVCCAQNRTAAMQHIAWASFSCWTAIVSSRWKVSKLSLPSPFLDGSSAYVMSEKDVV